MKYLSTRGGVSGLSFEDALLSGYALDGGMIFPETVPKVDPDQIRKWSKLPYLGLLKEIMSLFVSEDEMSRDDLNRVVDKAYSRYTEPGVVKITPLKAGLNILELFHGPTLSFKDIALSCVGQLLEYFLNKRQRHSTIVVGTSGDTGSAALESVRGLKWVDIIVLLPKSRCSRVQELQMTTVLADNVHIYRVDGTSDDLDIPLKTCLVDSDLVRKHNLNCINSINWVRVLVQTAHYFYSYHQLAPDCTGEVEIVVPTGACGNITGGVLAREMGLPVQLTSVVNSNDIVDRTFTHGDYSVGPTVETLATAMNIQVPYNIERILYLMNGHNAESVRNFMEDFEKTGKAEIDDDTKKKIRINSSTVDDTGITDTMKRCWRENNYLLCPHSATAVKYHYDCADRSGPPAVPRICVATASPAKFEEAVAIAGLTPQPNASVRDLDTKPTRYIDLEKSENWEQVVRDKMEEIYNMRKQLTS